MRLLGFVGKPVFLTVTRLVESRIHDSECRARVILQDSLIGLVSLAVFCLTAAATEPAVETARSKSVFDLQAHRGGMGEVKPGNSTAAFEHALDLAVTTLEMDVRATRDNQLVVIHDAVLPHEWRFDRGEAETVPSTREIESLSLQQLRRFSQEVRPGPGELPASFRRGIVIGEAQSTTVPTLEEVFQFVEKYADSPLKSNHLRARARRVQFCIELKHRGCERRLVALAQEHELCDRLIVQSFDLECLADVSRLDPRLRTLALSFLAVNPVVLHRSYPADYWGPFFRTLTRDKTEKAKQLGMRVVPWTVNDLDVLDELLEWGVDGVMTDNPSAFAEALRKKNVPF